MANQVVDKKEEVFQAVFSDITVADGYFLEVYK